MNERMQGGDMKNKMVSLFVAIMMFITISGCTAQENSLSGTARMMCRLRMMVLTQ